MAGEAVRTPSQRASRPSLSIADTVYRGQPKENIEGYEEGWYYKYLSNGSLDVELRQYDHEDQKNKENNLRRLLGEVIKGGESLFYLSPNCFHSSGSDHIPISRAGIPECFMYYRQLEYMFIPQKEADEELKQRLSASYIQEIRYAYTAHVAANTNSRQSKGVSDQEWADEVWKANGALLVKCTKFVKALKKGLDEPDDASQADQFKRELQKKLDEMWNLFKEEFVSTLYMAQLQSRQRSYYSVLNELEAETKRQSNYSFLLSVIPAIRNKAWKTFRSHEHLLAMFPRNRKSLESLGIVLRKHDDRYLKELEGRSTKTPGRTAASKNLQPAAVRLENSPATTGSGRQSLFLDTDIVDTSTELQESGCEQCRHTYLPLENKEHCRAKVYKFTPCHMHRGVVHAAHPTIQHELYPDEGNEAIATWTSYYYQIRGKCRCDDCKSSYQEVGDTGKPIKRFLDFLSNATNSVRRVTKSSKKTPTPADKDVRRELFDEGSEQQSVTKVPANPPSVAHTGGEDPNDIIVAADMHNTEGNGNGSPSGSGGRERESSGSGRDEDVDPQGQQNQGDPPRGPPRGGAGGGGPPSDHGSSSDEDEGGGDRRGRGGRRRSRSYSPRRRRHRDGLARGPRTPSPPRRQVAPVVQPIITQAALTLKGEGCPVFNGNVYSYQKWRPLVRAVFKTGYVPNARMHAQVLDRLTGPPRALVESIDIDEDSSAYRVLDALDAEYNKPWLASQLLMEQLFQLPNYVFNLSNSKEVLQSRQYVMHLMKIRTAMAHVPDAHANLKNLMDRIIQKMHRKLIIRWEDKCQDTAQTRHAAVYVGTNLEYFRQNQKFQNERFDDLISVLEEHIVKSKSIVDRVGKDGYLNPENVATSAIEAMNYQQKRLEGMQGGNNRQNNQQQSQQSSSTAQNQQRNNNQNGGRKTYNTNTTSAPPATNAAAQSAQQGRPQARPQGNNTQSGTTKGPPPGVPQVWQKACFICGAKNDHWPAQCKNPTGRSANSILKSCIKAKVCFNCLRDNADHRSRACPHGHCQVEGCMEKHHTLLHNAEWKRLTELQNEAKDELEKKAQAKAAKLEAKATAQAAASNTAQQGSSSANQRGGNRGNGGRRKRRAPQAPGNTNNVQQVNTVAQPVAPAAGSSAGQQ